MKEYLFIAIGIILCLLLCYIFLEPKFKQQKLITKKRIPQNITQVFTIGDDKFEVVGKQDNFIITKNNLIAFIVKDGQIIASRDLRISDKFVYYNGQEEKNDGAN